MARTIISTDSPADVPAEIRERYDIRVIPLHIILDDDCFEDGVNIQPDDLYAFYKKTGRLPKTSAVSVAEYTDFFKELTQDGSSVVHISFSSALSVTHQNARLAAEDFDNVYIVDSKSLSTGIALLAIKAAQLAQDGLDAKTIAHEMEYKREKVVTTFILDKLEFLYKGGRCSGVAMLGANVLGIKPSIVMVDGKLQVGKKYRGKLENCQMQYVRDLLEQYAGRIDTDRAFLSRTAGVSDGQMKALQKEIHKTLKFKEYIVSTVGCTITSHCGERTFTFEFMLK
ncbi:MAG TPA: DegV family protein [Candidatus Fimenecus excrementavium]|nr:DegV family protein [Candidatus Fimenecus excrementavium]